MTAFPTVEAVAEYVGGRPLLNRLALQVKEKPDGSLKLRLITDEVAAKRGESSAAGIVPI